MKKLFALLTVCALLCSAGVNCYAGEAALTDEKRQESFGIYATYIEGETEYFTALVRGGSSEIELPDKTIITVRNIPEGALTLVVYPIQKTDIDAWNWIEDCLDGAGSNQMPFEIYFLNQEGSFIPADGVTITIIFPKFMKDMFIFSLGTNGTVKSLAAQMKSEGITFTADGSRYYIFVEKEEEVSSGNTDSPIESDRPQTGDNSKCGLWIAMVFLSVLVLFIGRKYKGCADDLDSAR